MRAYAVTVLAVLISLAASDKYTTKYDNIDLDEIIKSDRLMKNYMDCVMERGNCTPDGTELKKNIPDALLNECENCSETQKAGAEKMLKHLAKDRREMFDEVSAKFDPDGKYRDRNREEFAKQGITL